MPIPKHCTLLFLRAPEKGRVKTRLAATLGEDITLTLYRLFVKDILETLTQAGYPVILCGYPEEKLAGISTWLGPALPCWSQFGNDLGGKMANAFSRAFSEGFDRVVLVGSDIPDLPPRIIRDAFSALGKEGAALGPATDGGYYLIAFRRSAFLPEAFKNISWSTGQVLAQTLAVFSDNGTPVRLLEQWRDIDTLEDIKALSARHPADISAAPGTLAYIKKAGFRGSKGRRIKGNDKNKT